ncbi:HNH endonuclease [Oceanihabitans sediminis]|uniref:HNH endonuclease n=1 Tax=Oceanihabitans sediminis TaxID=1812012 RepID=UPI00299D567F|nr:HNH endonuclease [Oceanihabitans sediminis]MDX1279321.1 HNH endonuclease [Oceanihabitans sediminis]
MTRQYIHRSVEQVKKECLSKFPDGNITREDRKNNKGLFLWMDRNMGGFRKAYKLIYGNEYIDKRTIVDKTGKNNGMYGIQRIGKNNPNWKGDKCITKINRRIRNSLEYKEWRLMVFGRDNFTCQICGKRGTYLHAHHIKSFANYEKIRFDVNNGLTLCKVCHRKIHFGDNRANL